MTMIMMWWKWYIISFPPHHNHCQCWCGCGRCGSWCACGFNAFNSIVAFIIALNAPSRSTKMMIFWIDKCSSQSSTSVDSLTLYAMLIDVVWTDLNTVTSLSPIHVRFTKFALHMVLRGWYHQGLPRCEGDTRKMWFRTFDPQYTKIGPNLWNKGRRYEIKTQNIEDKKFDGWLQIM